MRYPLKSFRCDNVDMHDMPKAPGEVRSSWSHAQKLRAGITWGFKTAGMRGTERWNNEATGNPSVSDLVSAYMVGLRRRKAAQGETPTSSRAVMPDVLRALYQFNHDPENWDKSQALNKDQWCGPNTRRLLQAIYLIAFTCILQIDEVLHIQAHDLKVYKDDEDVMCISITLNQRKNQHSGAIPPYILRELPAHMAHLCPVRAIAEWLSATWISHGYIFRKMDRRDHPILEGNVEIVRYHFCRQ
ncbi:hypothetical protein IW262DRAFT_1279888 [Armillaria fumosa]|nr:hypothetical protein IW262DRAFT_1279986 [Armillaria fumosa]KAK0213649.1 hypothetical protein IW262DRAFT_1279888 [Armillaria fumosa]